MPWFTYRFSSGAWQLATGAACVNSHQDAAIAQPPPVKAVQSTRMKSPLFGKYKPELREFTFGRCSDLDIQRHTADDLRWSPAETHRVRRLDRQAFPHPVFLTYWVSFGAEYTRKTQTLPTGFDHRSMLFYF